jgi:hypothetical protein
VVVAARRILVPSRGILPGDLEEVRSAGAALAGLDFTCGGRYARADVERLLEERVALATPGSWVEALPEGEPVVDGAGAAEESVPMATPSDESVDAYVTHGRLFAWIEGAARRSPAFAEELEAMIEADRAAAPTVTSWRARRWLVDRRGRSGAEPRERQPISIAGRPPARQAAADTAEPPAAPERTVRLGDLYPLDATALLHVTAEASTLVVSPAPGLELASVSLGAAVSRAADAEGMWQVTAPNTGRPIDLRVEARDGRVFAETFVLEPAE